MKIFLSLILIPYFLVGSQSFNDFDGAQNLWTREEIEKRLCHFLQKDGRVGSFFTLDDSAFVLYDAAETQKERQVEYRLQLASKKNVSKVASNRKNLIGVKIAIDPGHFGGSYARLEERYIDIPPSLEWAESIQFDEGTLSFLTALYLKVLLEKEGAIVMITRDQIGKGVYEEDFFDWLKKSPNLWSGEVSLHRLFYRFYNPLDLRARAKKINAFKPDLSIVIHYNAHPIEEVHSSNHAVCCKNYNMLFVPGAFCRNELVEQESRYEFMRLLSTQDLLESKKLCHCILDSFNKRLNIPVVSDEDGLRYLKNVCIKVDEGIYARNLALTRLIHGPVCYGETLIQNNIDECRKLAKTDFVIGGIPCSSRIKEVAEAYYEGIYNYLTKSGSEQKGM